MTRAANAKEAHATAEELLELAWEDVTTRAPGNRSAAIHEARECIKLAATFSGALNQRHAQGCECPSCKHVLKNAETELERRLRLVRA